MVTCPSELVIPDALISINSGPAQIRLQESENVVEEKFLLEYLHNYQIYNSSWLDHHYPFISINSRAQLFAVQIEMRSSRPILCFNPPNLHSPGCTILKFHMETGTEHFLESLHLFFILFNWPSPA